LGIKQPIQHILDVSREHRPDVIGMSGLLVKSTVIMRENLEEMNRRGVTTPVILGGAALTRAYVEDDCRRIYGGALYYAQDAFEGLSVMGRIMNGETAPAARDTKSKVEAPGEAKTASIEVPKRIAALTSTIAAAVPALAGRPAPISDRMSSRAWSKHAELSRDIDHPEPPFLGARIVEKIDLQSVLPYVNETTLFQFQWGYRRKGKATGPYQEFIKKKVRPIFHELSKKCAKEKILACKAAYGYWRCVPEGDALVLLDPKNESKEVARFAFPRQTAKHKRCLSDFFHAHDGKPDVVALMVVTVGQNASDVAREWFAADRYQDYLHLHGLSVEVAEGLAEFIHKQIRGELGIAGEDARDMKELFKQGYRGSRFSFGYPACPNLADQEILLGLLGAGKIGVQMSEEFQLWPEQSTSALVCHHPSAKYFTL